MQKNKRPFSKNTRSFKPARPAGAGRRDDDARRERPSAAGRPQRFKRDDDAFGGERKERSFGERKERSFGERKERSFGERKERGFGERKERSFGERKERSFGERKERSFGERKERGFGERKERSFGERKERGFGERKERSFGERKERSFGERKERGFGERNERGFGERKERSFGERNERGFGERKERSFGERKERSFDKPRSFRPRSEDAFREEKPARRERSSAPRAKRDTRKVTASVKVFPEREGVLIWGIHAVSEAWVNADRTCHHLWVTESGREALGDIFDKADAAQLARPDIEIVERVDIEALLPTGSVHQGVVLEAEPLPERELFEVLDQDAPELVVVLDQVTDPHNIGAILRSAAAFGAGALILTERNSPNTTGVVAKTASGALEHVPQIQVVNLVRALADLQQAGYWCVGLAEEGARELAALDLTGKTALVLGAEGDGLRRLTREHCDDLAHLPTTSTIGSLNVSNAAAVALYEVRRQKTKVAD